MRSPVAVGGSVARSDAVEHGQDAVAPFVRVLVEVSVKLRGLDGLGVHRESVHLQERREKKKKKKRVFVSDYSCILKLSCVMSKPQIRVRL